MNIILFTLLFVYIMYGRKVKENESTGSASAFSLYIDTRNKVKHFRYGHQ